MSSSRNAQIAALILQQSIEKGDFNRCLTHYNASDGTGQITVNVCDEEIVGYLLTQVFDQPCAIRSAIQHARETNNGMIYIILQGDQLHMHIVQSGKRVFSTSRSTQPHNV